MKTGFKNVLKDQKGKPGKYPFDFEAPAYDERSSSFIQAGESHGVGHRQPVGSFKVKSESPIPKGRVNTLNTFDER